MKLWKNYMTPGDVHDTTAMADSEWLDKISIWMDPNIFTPIETVITNTNKMISGGRYQLAETKGTMMDMPFEGISFLEYDNIKRGLTLPGRIILALAP